MMMIKQACLLLTVLLVQFVSAGPGPEQPIGENNPEFGRGRNRDRDRWTWCRCRVDDGPWGGRREL